MVNAREEFGTSNIERRIKGAFTWSVSPRGLRSEKVRIGARGMEFAGIIPAVRPFDEFALALRWRRGAIHLLAFTGRL
jgi:hypothetical protein